MIEASHEKSNIARGGGCRRNRVVAAQQQAFRIADFQLADHVCWMTKSDSFQIGDTVQLSGGYGPNPEWLPITKKVEGSLISFIPGQNHAPAAVTKLNRPLTYDGVSGNILVLELRYVDAVWPLTGIVTIELCDFVPEAKAWNERRQGTLVESAATYERRAD